MGSSEFLTRYKFSASNHFPEEANAQNPSEEQSKVCWKIKNKIQGEDKDQSKSQVEVKTKDT